MKKYHLILLCFVASTLGAVIMDERPHPLTLNGRSFGNAVMINGNLMMSIEDFARGATGTPNLGSNFQIQGNRLVALGAPHPSASMDTFTKPNAGAVVLQGNLFHFTKAGEISSHLLTVSGKTYVPVADVAHALGARGWMSPGTLTLGQSVNITAPGGTGGIITVGH